MYAEIVYAAFFDDYACGVVPRFCGFGHNCRFFNDRCRHSGYCRLCAESHLECFRIAVAECAGVEREVVLVSAFEVYWRSYQPVVLSTVGRRVVGSPAVAVGVGVVFLPCLAVVGGIDDCIVAERGVVGAVGTEVFAVWSGVCSDDYHVGDGFCGGVSFDVGRYAVAER